MEQMTSITKKVEDEVTTQINEVVTEFVDEDTTLKMQELQEATSDEKFKAAKEKVLNFNNLEDNEENIEKYDKA